MTTVMTITLTFNISYNSLMIDGKQYTNDGNNKWHFDYDNIFYKKIEGGGGTGGTTTYMNSFQTYRDTLTSMKIELKAQTSDTLNIDSNFIDGVFKDFINLTQFIITDTNDNNIYFGKSTFSRCIALNTFTIPSKNVINSTITLDDYMFNGCNSLITITLSNRVQIIPQGCFFACLNLSTLIIDYTVNTINLLAFCLCTNLQTINISNNSNNIGINFPSNLSTINRYTFMLCKNITQINIPSNINTIDIFAFAGCIKLSTILFTNSIIPNIPIACFFGCILLNNIILPNTITDIGGLAFGGCTNLVSITFLNTSLILSYTLNLGIFSGTNINYNSNIVLINYYNSIISQTTLQNYNKDYSNYISFAINNSNPSPDENFIKILALQIIQYYSIKDPKKFKNAMNDKQWLMYFFTYYNLQNK